MNVICWALAALLCTAGCKKEANGPSELPQAGYVSGKIVDTQGQPMKGVKVVVDNTIFYNSNIVTATDANGEYRVEVPNGSWRVTAETERTYNGQKYPIELDPDVYEDFAGSEGAIRNFHWKLTGEKPWGTNNYYGAFIDLRHDPNGGMYDVENVQFTLKPVGPRIDGSAGETLVLQCGAPNTGGYSLLRDLPIGRYQMTAVYKPTGQTLKLRNVNSNSYDHFPSLTIDFYGKESPRTCYNCIAIEYSEL